MLQQFVPTSQMSALLQMVHALPVVALGQLLPHQTTHHNSDPLLADDGILGLLQALRIIVVDAVKGGRDGGLLGQKGRRFGSRHCCWIWADWQEKAKSTVVVQLGL